MADLARRAIGDWLRRQRKALGMSQEEFRRALRREGVEVSQATVSRWERGVVSPPSELLPIVAEVLHGTLAELDELMRGTIDAGVDGVPLSRERVLQLAGEVARAAEMDHRERALELAAQVEASLDDACGGSQGEERARALLWLAHAYVDLGRLAAARRALARLATRPGASPAVRARELAVRAHLARVHGDGALVREMAAAYASLRDGLALRERAWCSHLLGDACREMGLAAEASEYARDALRAEEALHNPEGIARARALLALVLPGIGEAARAVGEAREALKVARERGYRDVEVFALRSLGLALAAAGDAEGALRTLDDGATYARRIGMPREELGCRIGAWRILRAAGRAREAREEAARIRELLPRVPSRSWSAREFLHAEGAGRRGAAKKRRRRRRSG